MEIIADRKPLVSVIIDTYNYGRFIEEAINSVLNQTFPVKNMEIIVVDDGSTDDTSERVKKYKDKIKYIYKENGGQASAFNVGFENARGEYIVLLDSDDFSLPNRVERVIEEFERYKDVGCVLNTRRIISNEGIRKESFPNFHNLELNEENVDLFVEASYGTSRTSLRKSILANILPLPEEGLKIEADLYINLAIVWFGHLSCLNEELTVYRIHGDNLFCLHAYDKLPLQIDSIKSALTKVRKTVTKSNNYNPSLLDKLLKPYEVEVREMEFALDTHRGLRKRKESLFIELEKIKLNWHKWSSLYKFYKIARLPFFLMLPPRALMELKNFYYKNKLYTLRNLIFPDK
jgi:glycosyltransferase involved in cell wall biosynthesis